MIIVKKLLIINMILLITVGWFIVYLTPECPACQLECPKNINYTGNFESLKQTVEGQDILLEEIIDKNYILDFRITDMMFIEEAQKRYMSVHEWTWETDCGVLTQDFTVIMKEFGIPMHKVYAWPESSNVGHAYNCVPFDVQVGQFDDTKEYSKYQYARTTLSYDYEVE